MMTFLAKPLAKYVIGALAILAIAFAVWRVLDRQYSKGEKAGKAEITNAIQTETIKQTEGARQEKEKANDAVRSKPIDSVIDDGLR